MDHFSLIFVVLPYWFEAANRGRIGKDVILVSLFINYENIKKLLM